jgi:hypothetical protein
VRKNRTAFSVLLGTSTHRGPAPVRRSPSTLPGLALAAGVFGSPCIYCLRGALEGRLFVGRYAFFGEASSSQGLVAWAVTIALASLWLGVSLQRGLIPRLPERTKHAAVVGVILAGMAILIFSTRLLSLRTAA